MPTAGKMKFGALGPADLHGDDEFAGQMARVAEQNLEGGGTSTGRGVKTKSGNKDVPWEKAFAVMVEKAAAELFGECKR